MTWFESVLAAALVLVTDQASKAVVLRSRLQQRSNIRRQFISISRALNRRGVLASLTPFALLLVWGVTVVLIVFALNSGDVLHLGGFGSVGFGVALGGATGNMLDRLRQGAIVDFIAVGRWPVFNLADVAIVVGVGLVLLSVCRATNAQDPL